jgi:hypothetical protein
MRTRLKARILAAFLVALTFAGSDAVALRRSAPSGGNGWTARGTLRKGRMLLTAGLMAATMLACNAPKPSSVPTTAALEKKIDSATAVKVGAVTYFVDGGHVFADTARTGGVGYVSGSSKVTRVTSFGDKLIAQRTSGDVFLWSGSDWAQIGENAKTVLSNGNHLLILNKKGEITAYRGAPGALQITFMPVVTSIYNGKGFTTTTTLIPMVGGRKMAFDPTGVKNVTSLRNGPGGAIVTFADGTSGPLSRYWR